MAIMRFSSAQLVERCHVSSALLLQVALFIFLLAGHIALVWLLPYFPTQDGPSHIYNLSILKDLRSGGAVWGGMYEQQLSLKPNLGFHIIAYPLLFLFDPQVVERLFISIYILMLSVSVPLLLKMIDKPVFPWSFFVFPATLSYSLAMGFYSYIIALPLVLLAGGLCWRIRNNSLLRQCAVVSICGAVIYCFHLIACAFFVILIAMQQFFSHQECIVTRLKRLLLILCPVGVLISYYVVSSANDPKLASMPFLIRLPQITSDLVTFVSIYFSPIQRINGLLLGLAFCLLVFWPGSLKLSETGKVFSAFCVVLIIVYFAAPSSFGGGTFFHERVPQMILLGLIPVVSGRYPRRVLTTSIIAISLICFGINAYSYREKSALVEDYMALQEIPLDSKSIVMSYKSRDTEHSRVTVLAHTVSLYALRHTLLNVGNYETQFRYFPVKLLPKVMSALPSADKVNYSADQIDFLEYPDIIYLVAWEEEIRDDFSNYFGIVAAHGKLTIWQRKQHF